MSGRRRGAAEEPQAAAAEVVQELQQAGHAAYWVGGCVRDFLLGRQPSDYDIATSALPQEVEALFKRTVAVGRQFGVVVVLKQRHAIQVATFRAESDYKDGRHPEKVKFADAKADALRRDFTVNGMFYDPIVLQTHDWVGGMADLKAKLIRTIGEPVERFSEDHLRLLRAVRFAAQLGFEIERGTWAAVKANAEKIASVSAERIREELLKLLAPPHAARGLELLVDSGLLHHALPEFVPCLTSEQSPEFHPEGTVYQHVLLMLEKLQPDADPLLAWAALLHDIGKPATFSREAGTGLIHNYGHERVGAEITEQLLTRLRFPSKQIDLLAHTVRCHMQFKDAPQMRKATLRRLLMRPSFEFELELNRLDCLGSCRSTEIYDFLKKEAATLAEQPGIKPPLVTGEDLKNLGMQPGPDMGRLLEEIRELQLQDELLTPEQALVYARRHMAENRAGLSE
jgi:poly(A) polymerase